MAAIYKGIRVRLYPTGEQKILIDKTIGCVRFVYNQTLADCKQSYEQSKHFPSRNERIKNLVPLKEKYEFLKEVDSQASQQSVRDFNHKLSRKLVEDYDLLAFEDLNVEGMKKKPPSSVFNRRRSLVATLRFHSIQM